jgi:hypothetical protein
MQPLGLDLTRRAALGAAGLGVAGLVLSPAVAAMRPAAPAGLRPALLRRAMAARALHATRIPHADTIGIIDFDAPSRTPRFHLVNLHGGQVTTLLVAHGRGSDPDHTGWLELFSNAPGSAASSAGTYLTGDVYDGEHGRSRRLIGLDRSNSNAESRSIVVHAAWYVSPDVIRDHGKLGRSEGCFAVAQTDLDQVLARLGRGHMIYADKV